MLCLLGHNGAGKSTLFNIMTGIIDQSEGEAKINGLNIRDNQDQIRRMMGVVPQFDILWDELTAEQHMLMFCRIKGVKQQYIKEHSEALLKMCKLDDVAQARICTFSGGMKRRMSLAISAIGNPKIMFMDEPTTGMDPVSRHDAWKLILQLKKDKTIVLTTHAMEEADALADRIAIVVAGSLKCVGTSLSLKNTFGEGYKISMVCSQSDQS